MSSFLPSAITQPFFELQTPDFAWKFVWIVQKITKVQEVSKYKSTHNSIILELQTPDFAWKFIWTVQPNEKVQKYKTEKYKNTKMPKNENMQISKKNCTV